VQPEAVSNQRFFRASRSGSSAFGVHRGVILCDYGELAESVFDLAQVPSLSHTGHCKTTPAIGNEILEGAKFSSLIALSLHPASLQGCLPCKWFADSRYLVDYGHKDNYLRFNWRILYRAHGPWVK
jgi:hypothetical protein